MSTNNIGFYEEISKISLKYHQISSNKHLISSAGIYSVAKFSSIFLSFSKNMASCYSVLSSQGLSLLLFSPVSIFPSHLLGSLLYSSVDSV